MSDRQAYIALAAFYALSRVALHALGIRYGIDYGWQHFHDLDLLRDHLWESLVYGHAFPPMMNLLVGAALKVAPNHAPAIYHGLFLALGLAFACSLLYLWRLVGLRRAPALGITAAFVSTPAFIYLEKFLHYELPTAALLCASAVLFHRALSTGRAASWLGFFALCALIVWMRLAFHLIWMLAVLGLALAFSPGNRKRVLACALLPVVLVLALYVKNQMLFGFFGTSSRLGFTMALVTTKRLSKLERNEWLRSGKLHPASRLNVYSGADEYAPYVDLPPPTGIAVLDRVRRRSGEPNYDQRALIDVSELLLRDTQRYLAEHPFRYLATALSGMVVYVSPTTRWHPKDPQGSPHRENRAVLEPYENAYNAAVHSFPVQPAGLYLLLFPLCALGALRALRTIVRQRFTGCSREQVIALLALHCAYVPAVGCVATWGELSRYRFMVEALLWVLAVFGAQKLLTVNVFQPGSSQTGQAGLP